MAHTTGHLLGWGYEGRTLTDLAEFVERNAVSTVVDVRLNAISRKPGLSKRGLREFLESRGVAYLHLPELGNPRDNRPGFGFPGTDTGDEARERYREDVLQAEDAQAALTRLAGLAEQGAVVLLCFEADERLCHRDQVLEAAAEVFARA